MFEYVGKVVNEIEASVQSPSLSLILPLLRRGLGLDDFGQLMISMPMQEFPKLSKALPRMATTEVQNQWTGSNGIPLLRQSANFVRSAAFNYTKLTGQTLNGASILDFGCGYGRLARLMYYFTDPQNLFGVDPWDRSIEICREDGLDENFLQSDYLPESLPLVINDFNFIYAFSVFTHLSERAAKMALDVCRRYISPAGIMLITIRPIEYWDLDRAIHGLTDTTHLKLAHRRFGFAFSPHDRVAVDGEVTYGDTSMTVEWLEANVPRWQVVNVDRSLDDAYQIYVALRPR